MPQNDKKKSSKSGKFDFIEDEKESVPTLPLEEAPSVSNKSGSKKRKVVSPASFSDDSDNEQNYEFKNNAGGESEMSSLLNSFGADISKTLSAKRKRLATFTSASLKTSNKKYDEIFVAQQSERDTMNEEFGKQIASVFTQWENDIQKSKEGEEKVEGILRQLQKTLQQQRVVQNQRAKSLKTLHDHYMKGISELSKVHREQQTNIHTELRKELSTLQKKMVDTARSEEISNVRKSLQSMLQSV